MSILITFVLVFQSFSIVLACEDEPVVNNNFIVPVTPKDEVTLISEGYTVIKTATDFDNIRNNPTGKFALAHDIDLYSYLDWAPIGTSASKFAGELDGNGYVVRNVTSTETSDGNPTVYTGLFGDVNGATIKNLGLENVTLNSYGDLGTLAGSVTNSTITNVYAKNSTINNNMTNLGAPTGGLIGWAIKSTISYSYVDVVINGGYVNTGGLVGLIYGDSTVPAVVTKSFTRGSAVGLDRVGGLFGLQREYTYVSDVFTDMTVRATSGTDLAGLAASTVHSIYFYVPEPVIYKNVAVFGSLINDEYPGTKSLFTDGGPSSYSGIYYNSANITVDGGYGVGKTIAELKQQATFNGWDFTNVWKINEGVSFPELR